jgi:hypothetical protein
MAGLPATAAVPIAGDALGAAKPTIKYGDDALRAVAASTRGWRVGDNVLAPTKAGTSPAWSTVRSRYRRNEAANPRIDAWSDANLETMRGGFASEMQRRERRDRVPAHRGGSGA